MSFRKAAGIPDDGYGVLIMGEKIMQPNYYSKAPIPHTGILNLFGRTILVDAWTRMRQGHQVLLLRVREASASSDFIHPDQRIRHRKRVQDYVEVRWEDEFTFMENK